MGLDSTALGLGLAGALVLALAACLLRVYVTPTLRVTRQTLPRPSSAARAALLGLQSDELEPSRRSLHALLRGCVELLRPLALAKGLKLELLMAPQLPDAVELDASRVHGTLVALIHGAIESIAAGSVKVHVAAIDTTAQSFKLRVRVEHTSAGVAERRRPGAGAVGGTYELLIPVARRAEPRGSAAPSSGPPPVPLRLPSPASPLLVVDDDELAQVDALELLESLGFEAELATGGQHAIELVATGTYALILMDCDMPDVDGYAATARIRGLAGPAPPIIACTASSSAEERTRALAAGMDDAVSKPLERHALSRVLAMWLPDEKNPASSCTRLSTVARSSAKPRAGDSETPHLAPRRRSDRLIDLFVTQLPDELSALAVSANTGRPDELARRAQRLKRTCLGCGAMKMAAICAALENAPRLSREELSAQLKKLGEGFQIVLSLLGEAAPGAESAAAPSSEHNPEPR